MIGNEVQILSRIFVTFIAYVRQTDGEESWAFLGEDSLAWLVLAFGAAMVVGNVLALVRPPSGDGSAEARKASLGRAVVMITIGALASVWGVASIVS